MAESSAPPTEEVKNLILDEQTGERVSKSEFKKREKQRRIQAHRADRAAAAPPAQTSKRKKDDEEELTPGQFYERRVGVIKRLKETQDPNPFPHHFAVDTDASEFLKKYEHLKPGEEHKDVEVRIAGRIFSTRESGNFLRFLVLRSNGQRIQIMCQVNNAASEAAFTKQQEHLQRGDYVGIIGFPGRTNPKNQANKEGNEPRGEVSVMAREVVLLAPCLHILPSEHFGFTDQEERFRKRHLDLIMNPSAIETLKIRSKVINHTRQFLINDGFTEVETPMINQIAGGATAKPFKTYYNAYDQEVFMRIAPELYLKELVVGGMERVFEIGKQFRNEDADLTHNPEFTTCEFYKAHTDMYGVMQMTEELVSSMVHAIHGKYETTYHTQHGEELHVNWAKPWQRVEIIPTLEKETGEKFPPSDQLHTEETNAFLKGVLKKVNVDCPPPQTNARMIDKLVGEFIEEKCINPTFIIEHPQMMSPLAKYHRSKPGLCERFEAFVCRKEIVNAYTELNDPMDQRLRFEEQARQKDQGDEEAQLVDYNFLDAMEYGLVGTGGFGMGIDRMVMFLADKYSIRDVLTFPYMKAVEENKGKEKLAAEVAGIEPMPAEDINAGK